ncbi:MAG: DUF1700 domain-containing protein [Novosphingobium sp.]|nr:DUF1700 domain-containing protein [Novosphingobium sp.]
MTRNEFLRRLRSGLSGMPAAEQNDIVADYEAHFDAGMEEGRSEIEIAEALGNPSRLARELRLESGVRQWREDRSPSAAWAAVIGFMGLATLDILILLPIFLSVLGLVVAFYAACFGLFVAGGAMMIVGPFAGFPGGGMVAFLMGLGVMGVAIAIGSILTLVSIGLINATIWFGRLHYRVIQPAIGKNDV